MVISGNADSRKPRIAMRVIRGLYFLKIFGLT